MNQIPRPKIRSSLRRSIGKEYFILKRRLKWRFGNHDWASTRSQSSLDHLVFSHKSIIRRPLKDVDMYLQDNKRKNLVLAIKPINNLLIQPGQSFSIWKMVGRPTKSKGYEEGLVLQQGKIKKGTGGGLCQLGNLLFWIFAHSPLTIVERHRHEYDVFPDFKRTVPFGAGATLAYNYIDLIVKNNSAFTFQIKLWIDDTYLQGKLICDTVLNASYKIEERNHHVKKQWWGGYSRHNEIVKIVTNKNGEIHESLLAENNAIMMYEPLLQESQFNNY
ncbi:MAG: VanW family protein [Bacteroidia bacterium]